MKRNDDSHSAHNILCQLNSNNGTRVRNFPLLLFQNNRNENAKKHKTDINYKVAICVRVEFN